MKTQTRTLWISVAIWISTVAIRCLLAFGLQWSDYSRAEAQNIGLNLATRGTFADAFAPGTGPTAHTAPVYPVINALFFFLAGNALLADQLRVLFNIAIAAAVYALLPVLALRLGLNIRAGILAGILGAVLPLHYWGELPGAFESTLSALLLLAFSFLISPHLNGTVIAPARAWSLGAFAGIAVLTSPALLVPIAGLFSFAWWHAPSAGAILRFVLATIAVLTPWTLRNLVHFHSLVFVRSNFGLELASSNNDQAVADAESNSATEYFRTHHPFASKEAAELVRAEGEVAYSRRMFSEALVWIRTHPLRFLRLSAERAAAFWFPNSRYTSHRIALGLMTMLAFAGWALLCRRNRTAFVVLAIAPFLYSLTFLFMQAAIRFTQPVWWTLLLGASVFVCSRSTPGACLHPPSS